MNKTAAPLAYSDTYFYLRNLFWLHVAKLSNFLVWEFTQFSATSRNRQCSLSEWTMLTQGRIWGTVSVKQSCYWCSFQSWMKEMISSDPFSSQMPFGNGIFSGHNWGCHGVTACFHRKFNRAVTTQDVLFYWQKADAPLTEEFLLTFSGTHKIIATWIFFWAFKGVEEWSKNALHTRL